MNQVSQHEFVKTVVSEDGDLEIGEDVAGNYHIYVRSRYVGAWSRQFWSENRLLIQVAEDSIAIRRAEDHLLVFGCPKALVFRETPEAEWHNVLDEEGGSRYVSFVDEDGGLVLEHDTESETTTEGK